MLLHPGLPTCAYCQEWQVEIPSGKPVKRGGVIQKRKGKPPCEICPKIDAANLPSGTIPGPHLAVELSERNLLALEYHKQGAAVGWQGVPADDVVRRHAAIIGECERAVQRAWDQVKTSLAIAGRKADA